MLGLIGVEGGRAIRSGLFRGLAHEALTCGLRRITLALLAILTGQAVGFGLHCWRREDQRREGIGRRALAPRRLMEGRPASSDGSAVAEGLAGDRKDQRRRSFRVCGNDRSQERTVTMIPCERVVWRILAVLIKDRQCIHIG